jgi:hypothetical protein
MRCATRCTSDDAGIVARAILPEVRESVRGSQGSRQVLAEGVLRGAAAREAKGLEKKAGA